MPDVRAMQVHETARLQLRCASVTTSKLACGSTSAYLDRLRFRKGGVKSQGETRLESRPIQKGPETI